MKWECTGGHTWEAPFNYIRSGSWCKLCGYNSSCVKLRGTLQSVHDCVERRGGKCLSDVYVNGKTKLQFECAEGHRWWARPDNIKSGKWCPGCKYSSKNS